MSGFVDVMLSAFFAWLQGLVNWAWAIIQRGGSQIGSWFLNNWIPLVLILIAVGVVVDWCIWMIRWRPYHVWATRIRRFTRIFARKPRLQTVPDAPFDPLPEDEEQDYVDSYVPTAEIHYDPEPEAQYDVYAPMGGGVEDRQPGYGDYLPDEALDGDTFIGNPVAPQEVYVPPSLQGHTQLVPADEEDEGVWDEPEAWEADGPTQVFSPSPTDPALENTMQWGGAALQNENEAPYDFPDEEDYRQTGDAAPPGQWDAPQGEYPYEEEPSFESMPDVTPVRAPAFEPREETDMPETETVYENFDQPDDLSSPSHEEEMEEALEPMEEEAMYDGYGRDYPEPPQKRRRWVLKRNAEEEERLTSPEGEELEDLDPLAAYDAPEVMQRMKQSASRPPEPAPRPERSAYAPPPQPEGDESALQGDVAEEPRRTRRRRSERHQNTGEVAPVSYDPDRNDASFSERPRRARRERGAQHTDPIQDMDFDDAYGDDLPDSVDLPDWSDTPQRSRQRPEIKPSKPSLIDRLRGIGGADSEAEGQDIGETKKRKLFGGFGDPMEFQDSQAYQAPRIKQEDAFHKPVYPDRDQDEQ